MTFSNQDINIYIYIYIFIRTSAESTYCMRYKRNDHNEDCYDVDDNAGDVYRRDSIDQSHYPVFHQMEGKPAVPLLGPLNIL